MMTTAWQAAGPLERGNGDDVVLVAVAVGVKLQVPEKGIQVSEGSLTSLSGQQAASTQPHTSHWDPVPGALSKKLT